MAGSTVSSGSPTDKQPFRSAAGLAAALVILAAAAALYGTAPRDGSFWWSDAPRHGLNGIFLKDVLVTLPLSAPKRFAMDWYVQYPALSILFYPPLFYALSAPAFLVFGESHAVAQGMVALHAAALGLGTYALAAAWLPLPAALAAALILLGLPEITLWGRTVMLEIPALAWLVWGAVFALRHARAGDAGSLWGAAACVLGALYTKLSMVFAVPALAWLLLRGRGVGMLAERRVWLASAAFLVGLAPLGAMTVLFGQANVQSVVAIPDTEASRRTLAGWVWYARALPGMATWPVLGLAALGLTASALGRIGRWGSGERTMLAAWFAVSYLALSFIELKEARHGVILLVPVAIWAAAGLAFAFGLAAALRPAAPALAATLAAAFFVAAMAWRPVPYIPGYREAVERAAALAPPDSTVLFSGYRDGSFIFNMRTAAGRPDLVTVRADKVLLSIAVRRELGVTQRDYDEAQILERIRELGVGVVVAQRDFWTDLEAMARLQRLLDGPDFEEVGRIEVAATVPVEDRELRIYRIRGEVRPRPATMAVDLPIIGRRIEGDARP
jgi:hypothetical protein